MLKQVLKTQNKRDEFLTHKKTLYENQYFFKNVSSSTHKNNKDANF